MNEKIKSMIILIIVLALFLGAPVIMIIKSAEGKKVLKEVETAMKADGMHLIYIGSTNCTYCKDYTPIIKGASENNNFVYEYFDIVSLNNSQRLKLAKLFDLESIGTPYTALMKDGELVGDLVGLVDETKLLSFLEDNDFISEVVPTETALTTIDYAGYEKLLASTEKKVVVFAQTTCGYCLQVKPYLEEIADEEDIEINYFNVNLLSSTEYSKLIKTLSLFEEEWGTPTMVVLENGKAVGTLPTATTKDGYIKFLTENGIIK